MGTPKKRKTKSGRNQRRSHHALKKINISKCAQCGSPILAHHICSNCGSYNGRKMVEAHAKLSTKQRKKIKEDKSGRDKANKTEAALADADKKKK